MAAVAELGSLGVTMRSHRNIPSILLMVGGVCIALYVIAYLVLVKPSFRHSIHGTGPWSKVPQYRFGITTGAPVWTDPGTPVFTPLVYLDQRLRPKRWSFTAEEFRMEFGITNRIK